MFLQQRKEVLMGHIVECPSMRRIMDYVEWCSTHWHTIMALGNDPEFEQRK